VQLRVPRRHWIAAGVVAILVFAAVLVVIKEGGRRHSLAIVDIDPYPARTTVTACARPLVGKPGVRSFRGMILSQVGGGDDGMAVCKRIANASREYSDHADGRAWDWHVDAARAADRAMVDRVLNWLLRTDDRGHRNAMARRIGITYIIWNHRYYRVGSDEARWVPYSGTADPHDTHVHFSFSVAGAARRTSWWTQRGPLVWSLATGSDAPIVFGEGALRPVAGDWDGDGRDSAGVYDVIGRRFTLRDAAAPTVPPLVGSVLATPPPTPSGGPTPSASDGPTPTSGSASAAPSATPTVSTPGGSPPGGSPPGGPAPDAPEITTPPVGPFGAIALAGDWDGLGGDEIGVYDPLSRRFSFLSTQGATVRPARTFGAAGDLPLVGDWNGDGVDDIGSYTPATQTYSLLLPDGTVRTEGFGSPNDTPVTGDWNGDGSDDIGAFRSSRHTFYRALLTAGGGSRALSPVSYGAARHLPVIGDWDGDGVDDNGLVNLS